MAKQSPLPGLGGATAITCDVHGCPTRFDSYSVANIVRKQASAIGWVRTKRSPTAPYARDLCPVHAAIERDKAQGYKMPAKRVQ